VAEGARLESVFTGNRNVGSNPTPSARALFRPVSANYKYSLNRLCYGHFLPWVVS
jgi:hypothetical protein